MVSSTDGGTAVAGLSGPLGGPADREVFAAIRAVPDVILVGAGTVRAERYGPPRLSEGRRQARVDAGRSAVPRLAIVSTRLDLDLESPLFSEAEQRPILLAAASTPADASARASSVADVVVAGDDRVDVSTALTRLHDLGAELVLCEGGPTLLGQVVAAGRLDELCLSFAPMVVAGPSSRIVNGAAADPPASMQLVHVLEDGGSLFLRYVRRA